METEGQGKEEKDKEKIEENLKKMEGMSEMYKFLSKESFGGNAGYYEGKPCGAANFYYDKSGRIVKFSNWPEEGLYRGTFKVVFHPASDWPFGKIVEVYLDKNSPEESKRILQETVEEYNKHIEKIEKEKIEKEREKTAL
jgi:hypothetical protein